MRRLRIGAESLRLA